MFSLVPTSLRAKSLVPMECWIFIVNIWPNFEFWAKSESGGQMKWLRTQHMTFTLNCILWGKLVPKEKGK